MVPMPLLLLLGAAAPVAASFSACAMRPTRLRTNNLAGNDALGVTLASPPRLNWALESTNPAARGLVQTAYRVSVCSTASCAAGWATPDLWDSGKVASTETLEVAVRAKLRPSLRAFWKVEVWDGNGNACESSAVAWFETALAPGEDGWAGSEWLARFAPAPLSADSCDLYDPLQERVHAPRFRAKLPEVAASVVAARAYIVGLGYYQLFIDGERIGTSQLDPGWTTYSKTVLYAVHDVTKQLTQADGDAATAAHVVGVELGNGWWNPMTLKMWGATDIRGALTTGQGRGNGTTTEPMFRLKIVGTMSDGTQKTLLSSSSSADAAGADAAGWTAASSPTTFNNIYLGEKYDATLEADAGPNAWSTVSAYERDSANSISAWTPAVPAGGVQALNLGVLEPQAVPPIRRQGTLPTTIVSTTKTATNTSVVLDSGKNHAGVCRFRLTGKAGDKVAMRYGELLNADRKTLNPMTSVAGQIKGPTENKCILNPGRSVDTGLHVAFQADELTLSGRADDWTPAYSWHGFRYIELTVPHGVTVDTTAVQCYPMRTDVELIANFSSSDPFLDQLRTLNRNTFDSNMMSVLPWAPEFWGAESFFGYGKSLPLKLSAADRVPMLRAARPLLTQGFCGLRNRFRAPKSSGAQVQSDCPHRERFGYGGDPLGCGEAGLSIYDWSTFYPKRVQDFNDAQTVDPSTGKPAAFPETSPFVGIRCGGCGADGGFTGGVPGFPGAGGPIGWQTYQPVTQLWLYKYYGQLKTMSASYEQTYAFVQMLEASAADPESTSIDGGLGDWMPVQGTSRSFTGPGFQRMAYLAFANITEILNKSKALTTHYRSLAETVAAKINSGFLNQSTGAYTAGSTFPENHRPGGTAVARAHKASQAGQGMALFEGIVPEALRPKALAIMAQNAQASEWILQKPSPNYPTSNATTGGPGAHMTAGLFGIKWFLMALADGGMNDLAYEVLTTPSFPGYRWMMDNAVDNATTIWEAWFFSDNTFSHNHPMFASSEVWLMQSVAGIQPHPAAKGFDQVLIKPSPPAKLHHAAGSYDTVRGRISTSWTRGDDDADAVTLKVTVPPNIRATVHVPASAEHGVMEGGVALEGGRREAGSLVFEVGSGEYEFVAYRL